MKEEQSRTRGLVAVEESKTRRRMGVSSAISGRFIIWVFITFAASAVFYWRQSQAEVESRKAALFARQRGVAAELGAKVDPLLQRVEKWTMDAAGAYAGDMVAPEVSKVDFTTLPAVYLRLRLADGRSSESIRKAAVRSLRDGFTACLFRVPNPDPTSGPACQATHDCAPGTFCNEVDHCMPPAQPYNMRAAYRGTRVLGEEWTIGLRTASDDMKMRLLEREFDSAVKDDIPLVIDLLTRAQFFLLVLDEDPAEGVSAKTTLEDVQAVPHAARVFLFGLKEGMDKPLLRVRREGAGRFMPMGQNAPTDPELVAAQQRQVNSCQLALQVREALSSH